MRILHLLEAAQGGTRRHVLDLLPALQLRGFNCGLIYSSRRYPAFIRDAQWLESCGVQTWDVAMARGFDGLNDARALRGIAQVMRGFAPDALHCHSTKAGMLGRLAASSQQIPTIYTPHCIAFDTNLPLRQRRAARLMETLLAPLTRAFIAVSHAERRAISRLGTRKTPIHVIANGIDLRAFDALMPPRNSAKTPLIGCFGRLTPQKNQAVLLHALPIVHRQIPNARLMLIGGGEDENSLRHLAHRLKIESAIQWTGELEEARPLYAQCQIVAQPSRWEGCPYSILEAMSAQRAVLGTDLPALREIFGTQNNRLLCELRAETFAACIIELLNDCHLRQSCAQQLRTRIEKHFDLQTMLDKTAAVYNSLQ